jgi:DNA-binding CsgD family transcriptional regulator
VHSRQPGSTVLEPDFPPFAEESIGALAQCRQLTDREREVLTLCCRGAKNSLIARALGVSVSAVRRHLRNLHHKTNTSDKAELILNLWYSSTRCPQPARSKMRAPIPRSQRRRAMSPCQ